VTVTAIVAIVGAALTIGLSRVARRVDAGRRARFLRVATGWRLPNAPRAWLERALADAAIEVTPETACELAVVGFAGIVMLTTAVSPSLLPVVAPLALLAGPIVLRAARGRAERRFVAALPDGLEQVSAALRGGASVPEALDVIAAARGPLATDLRRVRARASLGLGLADALATWPDDRPLPPVRAVSGALAVATTIGGRAADALDGLAASLRERLGALAEARALSSQARLSALVVGGAPVAFLVFSAVVDPSSVDVLLATDTGRVCLVVGLGCEALAALWMHRILGRDESA
jgi:tight adherence protein B